MLDLADDFGIRKTASALDIGNQMSHEMAKVLDLFQKNHSIQSSIERFEEISLETSSFS